MYLQLPPWELCHQIGKINHQRRDQGLPPCLGRLSPGLLRAVIRDCLGDCICLVGIRVTVKFCPSPTRSLQSPEAANYPRAERIVSQAIVSFLGTHLFLLRIICQPLMVLTVCPHPAPFPKKRTFKFQISDLTL